MAAHILIVDDEESIRFSLQGILEDEGYSLAVAGSGEEALAYVDRREPDLVFLDIWMPGMDGLTVLDRLRERGSFAPVVIISGHGTIETAVAAMKKGAFDFIEKPLSLEKVIIAARKALEFRDLRRENRALRSRLDVDQAQTLTGSSRVIAGLREQIGRVAPTDAWVLITGENGTGKEIVARMIHAGSRRADRPLIAVNCAAIPEELIESELFGHERGAFTGAERAAEGKFELADRGTLFLDEIGDMSLKTQAKILRILQEQTFERVGGRKTISVDVRVIAATNKDLPAAIAAGAFREDLYYRLKVFPLTVPPLRTRPEDIPSLVEEFVAALSRERHLDPIRFTPEAVSVLRGYPWPGNVRELKNFVERMLIMHAGRDGVADTDDLPSEIVEAVPAGAEELPLLDPAASPRDFKAARALFEAQFLETRLKECGGNVSRLAELIGLERSSLYRKLKGYNILIQE